MDFVIDSAAAMQDFGQRLGKLLKGGEVIELVGDVGAGKTTFTKGLALGLGITEDVQSPTFTISRVYPARDGLELAHYDFYRLNDPGILQMEINQVARDASTVTVIEWGAIVRDALPGERITIEFSSPSETTRLLKLVLPGNASGQLAEGLAA